MISEKFLESGVGKFRTSDAGSFQVHGFLLDLGPYSHSIEDSSHVRGKLDSCSDETQV